MHYKIKCRYVGSNSRLLWCLFLFCSITLFPHFQAVCGEVEQSERVKEKLQEDVNKLKQQIALRKSKTAEEERSTV